MANNSESNIKNVFNKYHNIKSDISPERRRNLQSLLGNIVSDKSNVEYTIFEENNTPYMWTKPYILNNSEQKILYCHGGGYVIGDVSYCKILSGKIAAASGYEVLSFEYPLAPENPFPAQLISAVDAFLYLCSISKSISIVGDSAGGHLVLSLVHKIKKDFPDYFNKIKNIVCMSPWTDLTITSKSYEEFKFTDPILSIESIENFRKLFAPDLDYNDPYLSPKNLDFTDFPPTLIQVGSNEILIDDSKILHENMKKYKVKSYFSPWLDMWHVFQTFPYGILPNARDAIDQASNFITKHF